MENDGAGGLLGNLQLLIPLVIIAILGIFMRRRRAKKGGSKAEVALSLLSDTQYNMKVAEALSVNWQSTKMFRTGTWSKNRDKVDFLDGRLREDLSTAYGLAEDYNRRIAKSKQYKSTSYLMGTEAGKLSSALAASKEGLETWLRQNLQAETSQRRRGPFG